MQEPVQQSAFPAEIGDNEDFSVPLRSIHHLKESNIKFFGQVASVDCLKYFHRYLKANKQITRIAIIGFNTGMVFCDFT